MFWGLTLVPARLQRLEVCVSVPDCLLRPEERRLVRQAAGGRKVGAGRLGQLARGEGGRLWARWPVRGTGLILPLSALLVRIEK